MTHLPAAKATEVFGAFKHSSLFWPWDGTEMFGLLGGVLVLAGLARAGVLGWWTVPALLGGLVGMMLVLWDLPSWARSPSSSSVRLLACVGVRLLQRGRLSQG